MTGARAFGRADMRNIVSKEPANVDPANVEPANMSKKFSPAHTATLATAVIVAVAIRITYTRP